MLLLMTVILLMLLVFILLEPLRYRSFDDAFIFFYYTAVCTASVVVDTKVHADIGIFCTRVFVVAAFVDIDADVVAISAASDVFVIAVVLMLLLLQLIITII